jgi:hypothetical protein
MKAVSEMHMVREYCTQIRCVLGQVLWIAAPGQGLCVFFAGGIVGKGKAPELGRGRN